MNHSSEARDKNENTLSGVPELDLPVDPGFLSESPKVSADVLYRWNLSQMKFYNSRPGAEEQRLREKCDVPFEL